MEHLLHKRKKKIAANKESEIKALEIATKSNAVMHAAGKTRQISGTSNRQHTS
jgi:hypothetical protein